MTTIIELVLMTMTNSDDNQYQDDDHDDNGDDGYVVAERFTARLTHRPVTNVCAAGCGFDPSSRH
jgi:hypothetical protein